MSYWGAQVIINLFGTSPGIGPDLVEWIRGDYGIGDATLTRFFSLHVVALPFIIALLVALHLVALRQVGSNNPDGIEIKATLGPDGKPVDGIPFHPYYTLKDIVGVGLFLTAFAIVVFFMPTFFGLFMEAPNFEPANPVSTPEHIAPVWYFTPYYSILRAIPPLFASQFPGVMAMGIATMILFFLPWLDRSPVKSIRYRGGLYKGWLAAFVVVFLILGYLGTAPTTVWGQFPVREGSVFDALLDTKDVATWVARVCTVVYFLFFLLMPWYTARDKVLPVPERVTV
jgi:ubiquinol-cytochrome c reductase cytochrome b subunit